MSSPEPTDAPGRRGRRSGGGAEGRRASRAVGTLRQLPAIARNIPLYEVYGEEGLALIEANAEIVLEEIGIEFRDDPEALDMWKAAGADVSGERVRFPKGLVRELLKTAPAEFVQHARNPERSVRIGGPHSVLVPAYGPPFVRSLDEGRRYATLEDFRNFVKLAYIAPGLHHSGGTVCEPVDLPVNKRHLDMVYSHIRYSDKPFMGSVTAPDRAEDTVELARILFGAEFVDQNTVIASLINANSPMVWDETMLGALKVYARSNQATVISPFILAGRHVPGDRRRNLRPAPRRGPRRHGHRPAPAPGGTGHLRHLRELHLHAVRRADLRHPGAGPGARDVAAALARRLGVPFRSGGGLCASKIPDAQAAYESANTLQAAMLAGVNFMLHAAGWLEGGLVMGYEKFVMDADQCGMIQTFTPGDRPLRERPGPRRHSRGGPRQALPRLPAHPVELRGRLLPLDHRRQQQLRAVARCRRPRHRATRQCHLEAAARRLRGPAARRKAGRGAHRLHGPSQGGAARQRVVAASPERPKALPSGSRRDRLTTGRRPPSPPTT
jgi:trimethylamine---corrinoid protein Co-methyltransferase